MVSEKCGDAESKRAPYPPPLRLARRVCYPQYTQKSLDMRAQEKLVGRKRDMKMARFLAKQAKESKEMVKKAAKETTEKTTKNDSTV
ncbi:Ribosomal_L30_N domain-containing protein [Caenorhabditis elegans]|nr:Ribosomal_L30_N domain-containing protein [Caenorhabditis elegans]CBK19472.1 Ribosomal_L30_N domain-containing protein [Caenorhabditis elegans]|eukprot:NP_001255342.1 Uncharacterized protein CELE_T11B7.2 [Caenorhabditis elegans]